MKFTVIWTPTAEQDLAALWVEHPKSRTGITRAARSVDLLLRENPQSRGESRYDTLRILIVHPLGVDFDVDEGNGIVSVLTVWHAGRRGSDG